MTTEANTATTGELVPVGRISGLYGVRGWVKIYSYTEPRENILKYNPWLLNLAGGWTPVELLEGKRHGKGVIARLAGCEDRDAAARWLNTELAIRRDQLPETAPGEFYWNDLIGLKVITTGGIELGVVKDLMETGANDVLVVDGEVERLIPYVPDDVVVDVDLEAGELRVDWDPEF